MKTCNKCHIDYPDHRKYCGKCGSPLSSAISTADVISKDKVKENGIGYTPTTSDIKLKNKRFRNRAIITALIVILCLSSICYYFGREAFIITSPKGLNTSISISKNGNELLRVANTVLETGLLFFGDYNLKIETEGYQTHNGILSSRFGRNINMVNIEMEPLFGSIKITTDPSNAKVYLKNIYQQLECSTPCEIHKVFAVENEIEIRPTNYSPLKIKKTLFSDQRIDLLNLKFVGSLKIDSSALESDVFINDKYKGKTPIVVYDLPAKKTKIEIKKKGFSVYQTFLEIQPQIFNDLGKVVLREIDADKIK
jgi:hypothetical protein